MRWFPRKKVRRLILVCWLFFVSFWIFYKSFIGLSNTTYAYTYSLGDGCGFTVYNQGYYALPNILQESVRVHEYQHLQDGTLRFWDKDNLELRACKAELQHVLSRKAQLREVMACGRTASRSMLEDYGSLEVFQADLERNIKNLESTSQPVTR